MPHVAKPGLAPVGLAIQPGLRVRGALMRVILARLAAKLPAIARISAILRPEALVRGPGLDQRAVHREMLIRQQRPDLGRIEQPGHEYLEYLAPLQPLAVLGEHRHVPYRIIR